MGNTLFGLLATAALLIIGFIGVQFTGLLDGIEFDVASIPLMLLAFIIGMLLFGSLYSAAGAMVSRTEDLQSTQAHHDSHAGHGLRTHVWFHEAGHHVDGSLGVGSTIQPHHRATTDGQRQHGAVAGTDCFRYRSGGYRCDLGLVARIYRRAILHNGTKLSWLKAIKA